MSKMYGYARVSSVDQNLESQIDELEKIGCDEIISEKITGVSTDRKLVKLIEDRLEKDDTLVVLDVTRFGRNTQQSLRMAEEIQKKGASLVIKDLGVDTRTPSGQLVFSVMVSMSEFERKLAKERQRRGIDKAKRKGTHMGRPRTWKRAQMKEALHQYQSTEKTIKEICGATGVSRASLYRHLNKNGVLTRNF